MAIDKKFQRISYANIESLDSISGAFRRTGRASADVATKAFRWDD